jgi:16S rRNA C1402 (ribose-2'-O) methylase RsmI
MPNEAKIRQLANTIDEILQRQDKMDVFVYEELGKVYEAISRLAEQKKLQEPKPRNKIGFQIPNQNTDLL